jgi:arylsulfatase A-like enzyme
MVDTLRADHLGVYGYQRDTSPHIDLFARDAVVFANARAQAPCTFPSVNSLLTSRDPSAFANQLGRMIGIPAAVPSVAEILAREGYRTLAVSASTVVRKTRSDNNYFGGFGRGFEVFDEQCERRPAACLNRRALELLDGSEDERPFFLYLHYLDPHDPYRPPDDHERRFAKPWRGRRFVAEGNPNPLVKQLERGARPASLRAAAAHLGDLYDEEIAYFDGQFDALLGALDERGLAERTLVVLLSDHGEDFLEPRFVKHCRSVRETQIRTPLLVRLPDGPSGRVVRTAAGNIDIVPTLLDYLGVDAGDVRFDGRSLRPLIEGGEEPERAVFSSWHVWRSVVRGNHKLILHLPSRKARLFDLESDPHESLDRSAELEEIAAGLRAAVEAHHERVEGRGSASRSDSSGEADDTLERLRALGYLE